MLPNRRSFLTVLSLLALGLSACGQAGSNSTSTSGSQATKPSADQEKFSHSPAGYDLTITLDGPANTVVADFYSAAALHPYGFKADGVWGYGADDPGNELVVEEQNILGLDADLSIEKLAALKPDLIIGVGNEDGSGWTWWDEKVTAQVADVAPYLPVKMRQLPTELIEEYAAIAASLGLDVDTPEVQADKKRYEDALAALEKTAKEKGDSITVLALGASKDEVWTSRYLGVIRLLEEHGVNVIGPDHPEEQPWASTSWENIGDYKADIVLELDSTKDATSDHPTFKKLPAVEAGQVIGWNDKRAYTYKGYADWLEELVELLERSEDIVA